VWVLSISTASNVPCVETVVEGPTTTRRSRRALSDPARLCRAPAFCFLPWPIYLTILAAPSVLFCVHHDAEY
jgi:hypothetical protein